ncbi:F-type H+-transporting ATPase subunit b [Albidovulum inexpectatum]|uniref:ATP synthase subunit b n=1 Tax=Albidovulum inexpectatum TaxID=196587 RepID=A0A2S5JG14_9RHOB|nr:F0F1 ATP synthase subunit B' [Albidovulum inexpectatum]PPB80447.1 F-type H+-transporting ATPase subunit b [Albidovulum inexpectatum]
MANTTHDTAATLGHGADHAAQAAGHAAQSAGMPQLDLSTFANQIFWLVVALIAIYFILSRIALPRISGILADRQGKITSDLAAAEELKAKAVEAEKAYNEALANARAQAAKIIAEARAEIQADLDKAMAKADAEIAAKAAESAKRIEEIRANAAKTVAEVAREAAVEIVAMFGAQADEQAVAAAVEARLKG